MATLEKTVCDRCMGKKRLPHYSHVENGVCFACKGTGLLTVRVAKAAQQGPVEPEEPRKTKWVDVLGHRVLLVLSNKHRHNFHAEDDQGLELFYFRVVDGDILNLCFTGHGYAHFGLQEDRYGMYKTQDQKDVLRDTRADLQRKLKR